MSRPVRRYWGTPRNEPVLPVTPALDWSRAARHVGARAALALAAALALWAGAARLASSRAFAIREVAVTGATHADPAALAKATGLVGRGVLTADLEEARRRLAREPWVADAALRRVPPQAVEVKVTERVPVGLLADGRVLAADGALLPAPATALPALPAVRLPERDVAAAALSGETLAAIARRLPAFAARVTALDASDAAALVLTARDAPTIVLAGPESVDQLAGWLERERRLERAIGGIEKVDARWRGRLFVTPSPSRSTSHARTPGPPTGGRPEQGTGERHGEG